MEENSDDETQRNASKTEVSSTKLKRELIAKTDFFGETKVNKKLTTYTWALKDFRTLIKIREHVDTKSFKLCDDLEIECFLSIDFHNRMTVHMTFCDAIPATHSYEIILHVVDEENLSSSRDSICVRDVIKGTNISFVGFLSIMGEELDDFLVDGHLFLRCEITQMDLTSLVRNNIIEITGKKISDDISNLLKKQLLTDVTLIVGEREFKAHKCILAARSPVFLAMFYSDMIENRENKVVLEDADPECIQKLLEFVYLDKVENIQSNTDKLLEIADKYNIKGLKLLCAQELCKNIEVDSSINIFMWADRYNVRELKERVLSFIRSHMKDVLDSAAYNEVIWQQPGLLKKIFCSGLSPASKR